jgi:hypothetical protein
MAAALKSIKSTCGRLEKHGYLMIAKRCYTTEPDRPFTLPPGEYKPKQSLGQNFLSDQNIIRNIVSCFSDDSPVIILLVAKNPLKSRYIGRNSCLRIRTWFGSINTCSSQELPRYGIYICM